MTRIPRPALKLSLLLFVTAFAASCEKNEVVQVNENRTISATLNGANEVPAVTTSATGSLTGTYNTVTRVVSFTVTWTGLTGPAIAMHFHGPGTTTQAVPVAIGFTGFPAAASGSYTGTATLTQAQENDLFAGLWYYNIHTNANKGGEIRGQVSIQ